MVFLRIMETISVKTHIAPNDPVIAINPPKPSGKMNLEMMIENIIPNTADA